MAIRQIPGDILLRRVPRLVRDVAQIQTSKCRLTASAMIFIWIKARRTVEAPLTHLVRNAIDHGIESADQRGEKDQKAQLTVSLEEEISVFYSKFQMMVASNFDAIRSAAVEREMIKPDQELDHEAIIQLIFASGVSTAKEVSEISGRGVGLDVVHANIVAAGGFAAVESETDIGTTFTISVPKSVTTQIIMGFMVDACHTPIIPMDRIRDSIRYPKELHRLSEDVYGMNATATCCWFTHGFNVRRGNYPGNSLRDDAKRVAVRCDLGPNNQENGQQCQVVVDQVLGVQQVKPVPSTAWTLKMASYLAEPCWVMALYP